MGTGDRSLRPARRRGLRKLSCCVSSMGRWWDSAVLWTLFTRYDNWESSPHPQETDLGGSKRDTPARASGDEARGSSHRIVLGGVLHSRLGMVLSSSCGGTAHGRPT